MNIAILHHDLEWTEKEFERIFKTKFKGKLTRFDVRETKVEDIKKSKPTMILNRVYASVANRDYASLKKTLGLIKDLEESGFSVINSLEATKGDYSKHYAFKLMEKGHIKTPKTALYSKKLDLSKVVESLGSFPIIIKRDAGGRGKDLAKCDSIKDIGEVTSKIESSKDYTGGIIMQEFLESTEDSDYRIWVVRNEIPFYHKRSLISVKENEKPWLASRSLGSEIFTAREGLPENLGTLAISAAKTISAKFDVLDVINTKDGYAIIEQNPTPNLRPEYEDIIGFNPVEFLLKEIIKAK